MSVQTGNARGKRTCGATWGSAGYARNRLRVGLRNNFAWLNLRLARSSISAMVRMAALLSTTNRPFCSVDQLLDAILSRQLLRVADLHGIGRGSVHACQVRIAMVRRWVVVGDVGEEKEPECKCKVPRSICASTTGGSGMVMAVRGSMQRAKSVRAPWARAGGGGRHPPAGPMRGDFIT